MNLSSKLSMSRHLFRQLRTAASQRTFAQMPARVPQVPHHASGFIDFTDASPTPFHVVRTASAQLLAAGFTRIQEKDAFSFAGYSASSIASKDAPSLKAGGKFFYTRNQSAIIAFTLPHKASAKAGIIAVAGHTDSPALKLRPISKKIKGSYLLAGVEVYGGGRFSTWFDRDLSLAGRVIISTPATTSSAPSYTSRLIKINRPILRIPTLAIHLDNTPDDTFKFNKETELVPILGEYVKENLNGKMESQKAGGEAEGTPVARARDAENSSSGEVASDGMSELARTTSKFSLESWEETSVPSDSPTQATSDTGTQTPSTSAPTTAHPVTSATTQSSNETVTFHHTVLLRAIADELDCEIEDIQDFELSLYDTQKGTIGGINGEYIFTGHIDNQMTCYTSIQGLIDAAGKDAQVASEDGEENIRCVALFDNEEVGSVSYQGAESDLLSSFIRRMVACGVVEGDLSQVLAKSYLISSDTAHAVHPNYESNHEENLRPTLNGGVVVKCSANQKYTSNAPTIFLLKQVAKKAGVPLQYFEIKNNSRGGSTVGPGLSTIGLRTIDIGIPQLSMHSIREQCGSKGPGYLVKLISAFFSGFSAVDDSLGFD